MQRSLEQFVLVLHITMQVNNETVRVNRNLPKRRNQGQAIQVLRSNCKFD